MPQTRSRSASQRRNINYNTGNNISAMVNRTSNNNQMDNMTLNSIGSTINISNGNETSAASNLISQFSNETMVNGSSDSLDIEINQENRNTINSKVHVQRRMPAAHRSFPSEGTRDNIYIIGKVSSSRTTLSIRSK